jgi:hypothetical protein
MDLGKYIKAINESAEKISNEPTAMIQMLGEEVKNLLKIDDASIDSAVFGLMYDAVDKENEERRAEHGYLAPMYEFQNGVFPKPVSKATDDEVHCWFVLASQDIHPAAKARYSELLSLRTTGKDKYAYVMKAIESHRQFGNSQWPSGLDRKDALNRAFELAISYSKQEVTDEITDEMIALASENLGGDDPAAGIALPLLLAATENVGGRSGEILALNDIAIDKFRGNGFAIDAAQEIQVKLAAPENRNDLYREQAEYLLKEAEQIPAGFQQFYLLHEVEAFAELHGVQDIKARAVSLAESIPEDAMGFREHGLNLEISREDTDKYAEFVCGDDGNLPMALRRFGATNVLASYEEHKKIAERQAVDHPVLMLFSQVNMGEANSIVNTNTSDDDKLQASIIEHERFEIIYFSIYAIEALSAIGENHELSVETLTEAFKSDLITDNEAVTISRGVMHYVKGDEDSAVKCLTPIAERIIRHAARKSQIATTQSANTSRATAGGVKGLGAILSSMKGFIRSEELRRYWFNSLVEDKGGFNLRNRVGHSLTLNFDRPDAAIVIHVICTLLTLTIEKVE